MSISLPEPIRLAKALGYPLFATPYDANWIVLRSKDGKPDEFDGLSTLSWVETGGAWETVSIIAATRPGTEYLKHPMNANGTAGVKPGRYSLSHAPGFHGENKTPALVQVGPIVVLRDNDLDLLFDPSAKTWNDAAGVNHHQIDNPKYLAGCIGSPQAQLAVLLAAFKRLQGLRAQPKVSLTLIEV